MIEFVANMNVSNKFNVAEIYEYHPPSILPYSDNNSGASSSKVGGTDAEELNTGNLDEAE